MARPLSKTPKKSAGVRLEIEVLEYLDDVANSDDRDRSYVINRIIREWAESKGTPIPTVRKESRRVRAAQ